MVAKKVGTTKFGWCMTGHHEGTGKGECWKIILDRKCTCPCHKEKK